VMGEEAENEFRFLGNIIFCHSSRSPLAGHAHHFDALEFARHFERSRTPWPEGSGAMYGPPPDCKGKVEG
jgi:hypothetical protein